MWRNLPRFWILPFNFHYPIKEIWQQHFWFIQVITSKVDQNIAYRFLSFHVLSLITIIRITIWHLANSFAGRMYFFTRGVSLNNYWSWSECRSCTAQETWHLGMDLKDEGLSILGMCGQMSSSLVCSSLSCNAFMRWSASWDLQAGNLNLQLVVLHGSSLWRSATHFFIVCTTEKRPIELDTSWLSSKLKKTRKRFWTIYLVLI